MKLQEFLLNEGGNAMSTSGVQRVPKQLVNSIVEYVGKISGIHKNDLHLIGSTGKVTDSGDIDLAIDSTKYDPENVSSRMAAKFGKEHVKYDHSTKVYSFAVPMVKRVTKDEFAEVGGKAQVDLMFTPKVEWAKFAYHSEGSTGMQTSYKGAIRGILLKAVASVVEERGTDAFVYHPESKELIIRVGRTLDMTKGLRRVFQVRPERKNIGGGQYLATMQTVKTIEELKPVFNELKKQYPGKFDHIHLDVPDHEIVIDDPNKFLQVMFPGDSVSVEDVKTAEGVLDLIVARFPPAKQVRIFEKAKQYMKQVHGSMREPELDEFIKDAKRKME